MRNLTIKLLLTLQVFGHQKRRFSVGPWPTIVSMQLARGKGVVPIGDAINRSFISVYFLLNAYFLIAWTYKGMCLIIQIYGISNICEFYAKNAIIIFHTTNILVQLKKYQATILECRNVLTSCIAPPMHKYYVLFFNSHFLWCMQCGKGQIIVNQPSLIRT